MNSKIKIEKEQKLPPTIPGNKNQLKRTITLLGNRAKSEKLNSSTKKELIELVGAYPDSKTAQEWKNFLKKLVKNLPDPEPKEKVKLEPCATYTCSLKRKYFLDQFEVVTGTFGETKIILEYLKYKLQNYYLDDEERYDERFLKQLRYWYQWFPSNVRDREFSKKVFGVCVAEELAEDSFDFDYRDYKYDLSQQRITAPDSPEFVEPLLRWALSKVDWKLLTKQLLKMFDMVDASKFNEDLMKRGYK